MLPDAISITRTCNAKSFFMSDYRIRVMFTFAEVNGDNMTIALSYSHQKS